MSEKAGAEKLVKTGLSRRGFFAYFSTLGIASVAFPKTLWAQAEEKGIVTNEMLKEAEKVAGVEFTDKERELMLQGLDDFLESYQAIRKLEIPNSVSPAIQFNPVPDNEKPVQGTKGKSDGLPGSVKEPSSDNELAFMPMVKLAQLIKSKKISSEELTKFYLKRLHNYGPMLECTHDITVARALKSARQADNDIASGTYRGPLHGIPWGAKDLLAAKGYKTTWGAMPFKDQVIDEDAEVVKRLDNAGAVLTAKLTLGALAWGDVWFGGVTKNPWNPEQGSSGSSAGPASASAAGLVGFSIGSETWGSIVSPCTRCGTTGLRPTFGRVPRTGAMALSWTMDKLGPIARSAEDCAYVFEAIHGADGRDLTAKDHPFAWKRNVNPKKVRLGYLKGAFEAKREQQKEWQQFDLDTLKVLESLGYELVPIELPDFPISALSFILSVEAAAAFDELTMSGRDDLLVRQIRNAWPNSFRQARMVPAVEYLQANRARTMLMQKVVDVVKDVDLYVAPSFGPSLLMTNLTGHPAIVLPNGFREDGTPTSITFTGKLFGEEMLLAVANSYQQATDFHRQHPDLEAFRVKLEELKKKEKEEKKDPS